jgi:signal transduction histidine kinase
VGRLREAVERAASLVSQLLAFSRKQPLQPQPLDLNQAIHGMKDLIRGILNEQIEIVLKLSPDIERADADRRQLEQIILNLCTNARDAMPNGGKLTIRTWNAGKERVGLEIVDTAKAWMKQHRAESSSPSSQPSPWARDSASAWRPSTEP